MHIRPYQSGTDYDYLEKWVDNEKTHALWCANLISYPLKKEAFHQFLEKNAADWMDRAYIATEGSGEPVGFFCYSINTETDTGFLKFILVDHQKRGQGYGQKMLRLALQYAFRATNAASIQLNVFAENTAAKHCYEKVGFIQKKLEQPTFLYKDQLWSRCNMIVVK